MEEQVYLLWDCTACGHTGIPCSPDHRYCPQCDHPRTFEEFDSAYLPGDDASWAAHQHNVIPPDVAARLERAGASWFCVNCSCDNYGDEASCHHCDAPRGATSESLREGAGSFETFTQFEEGDQGATADLVEAFGGYAGQRAAHGLSFDPDASHEGQHEAANAGRSAFRGEMDGAHEARPEWEEAALPSTALAETTHKTDATPRTPARRKRAALAGGGVLTVGLVTAAVLGLGGDRVVEVPIAELRWKRTIDEDRWVTVKREGWKHELTERAPRPPVKGEGEQPGVKLLTCADRFHHNEPYTCGKQQVPCTHQDPYTERYACTKQVPYTERYACTKRVSYTERYSCTRSESYTERYSCSKRESYTCGTYKCRCRTVRRSNGTASRKCSTCTKRCTRTVSSTCTRSKTRRVPSTCTRTKYRTEPDTCTRTKYRTEPDTCTRTKYRDRHPFDVVDKICQRPIQKPHCTYETQEWQDQEPRVLEGTGHEARWPEAPGGTLTRDTRSEWYQVVLRTGRGADAETYRVHPRQYTLFQRLRVGEKLVLRVSRSGSVYGWRLPGEPEDAWRY